MRIRHLFAGLAFAFVSGVALAQPLRDPTRPPGGATVPAKKTNSGKARSHEGMVLQTVLVSSDRRRAVISGRLMAVGERIGSYRLQEIRDSEVVMKGPGGTRTLRLFPSVTKVDADLPDNKKGFE